jgi:hypothetical protein
MEVKRLLKTISVGLATLAVAASAAVAAPDKGKPPKTGPGCKPGVTVILKGTIAEAPGGGATLPFSLKVKVSHANSLGQAYVKATQPVTVMVIDKTKIRRETKKGLAALQAMQVTDRVLVQSRVCKADLAGGATPALTANRVTAHPAKP